MGRLLYAKALVATGESLANDHLRNLLACSRLSVCATKVQVSGHGRWQMVTIRRVCLGESQVDGVTKRKIYGDWQTEGRLRSWHGVTARSYDPG
jgi:hypothetical protein